MLQLLSEIQIVDNSGAKKGKVIKVLNKKKYGKIKDI